MKLYAAFSLIWNYIQHFQCVAIIDFANPLSERAGGKFSPPNPVFIIYKVDSQCSKANIVFLGGRLCLSWQCVFEGGDRSYLGFPTKECAVIIIDLFSCLKLYTTFSFNLKPCTTFSFNWNHMQHFHWSETIYIFNYLKLHLIWNLYIYNIIWWSQIMIMISLTFLLLLRHFAQIQKFCLCTGELYIWNNGGGRGIGKRRRFSVNLSK